MLEVGAGQDLIESNSFLVVGQRSGHVRADLSLPAGSSPHPLRQLVGKTHRHPLHTIITPRGGQHAPSIEARPG